jgi:hypothetical protein
VSEWIYDPSPDDLAEAASDGRMVEFRSRHVRQWSPSGLVAAAHFRELLSFYDYEYRMESK